MNRHRFHPGSSPLLSLGFVAALYVATLGIVGADGFWTTDNSVKFLQVLAVTERGAMDASFDWAGAAVDPELEFNPIPFPFTIVRAGTIHGQYLPLFALASSVPYRLLGFAGLHLLPLAGALLLLGGTARLAGLLQDSAGVRHAAVIVAGACTPVWFYATTFWEHTPAAALAVWAVVWHLRYLRTGSVRELVVSSALAAGGAWFREEQVLLCVLLAVLATFRSSTRLRTLAVACVTSAVVLAPLALFLWSTVGSPVGLHADANLGLSHQHLLTRGTVFYNLFLAADREVWLSLMVTLPCVTLFFWCPRLADGRFRRLASIAGLLAVLGATVSLLRYGGADGPIRQMTSANSLFPAAPVIVFALLRPIGGESEIAQRRVWQIALGYALLYTLAAPAISSRGIHWGGRFLLLLYPLLAAAAAANLHHWFRVSRGGAFSKLIAVSAIGLSFAAQLYSVHLLHERKQFSRRLNEVVEARSEPVIVTDDRWAGADLYSQYSKRPMFYTRTPDAWRMLRIRLLAASHRDALLVRRSVGIPPPPGATVVDDGDLDYFTMTLQTGHF